jgi:uncharacterized protein (TIGR03435 family)
MAWIRQARLTAGIAFLACSALAQAADSITFEVASVKPSPPVPSSGGVYFGPARGGPGTPDPGQITWTYARFRDLLMAAYDVKTYQINGPAWMDSERYDIVAKVPAKATKDQVGLMWQNLLAERFALTLRHEPREFQVEELVIAKGGPKLKETSEDPAAVMSPEPPRLKDGALSAPGMVITIMPGANGANAHSVARAQPIARLTAMMSGQIGRPVLDKTGMAGHYDFTLDFTMPLPGQGAGDSASEPGLDLAAAVQQQLGLRLVANKAKLDVLVIEKADKVPTAN